MDPVGRRPGAASRDANASDATGKKFKLAPSPAFLASEKKLEGLEHTVLSESIPMTDDGGSLSVTVTINGKHRKEMIVDSGATTSVSSLCDGQGNGDRTEIE